jgi:uncharacterized membrane protein
MPDLGVYHPQITEFVVALLMVGVAARWISLTGKLAFTRPAAAALLLLGTVAAVAAVRSGLDAPEAVERVPGIGAAVNAHEQWAKNTRTVFLVIAGLEIVGLGLALVRLPTFRRWAEVASAVVGLGGAYLLYGTADRGGDLVFNYAGGVGIRSGDTADVSHLLTAGLFEQAMVARRAHRPAEADTLLSELARLHPSDPNVQLVHAQSLLEDRKDPRAALAVLDSIVVPDSLPFMRSRVAFQKVDALAAGGMPDSARAVLTALGSEFAGNPRVSARIKERLEKLR